MTDNLDIKTLMELAKLKKENPEEYDNVLVVMKNIICDLMKVTQDALKEMTT